MDLRSLPISARWTSALLLPAAIVAPAPALHAQTAEEDSYMGESPERFASVKVLEGEATIRKGETEESLSRGIPVAEGDVVESHGRGILQLADGTRVAFAPGTRFQVAALFTDQEEERQVLLRLDYGRLRVSLGRESEAQVRIDMPSGSALLSEGASVSLEMEQDRTARVKVHSGRMTFSNEQDRASLLAGERLTVYSGQDRLDRIQAFNTYSTDAFDAWTEQKLAVRRGSSWDKVPPEIRYHSDDLDEHGEWIYVDEYRSWCWRPLRVSAEWRPYWRGRWGAYPGGMTWISDEPWGYVTYHHGRWGWGAGLGWYWIPGIYYAPAWVAWHTSDLYFGWAPLGYHNHPVTWGYGPWHGGYSWNIVEINFIHVHHVHTRIHHEPHVIHHFDPAPRPAGNRPLAHPWHRTPVIVNQAEFRNPAKLRQVLQDPATHQERLESYARQPGRTIHRRPLRPAGTSEAAPLTGSGVARFEDRSPLQTQPRKPIVRQQTTYTQPRPAGVNRPLPRPQPLPPPPPRPNAIQTGPAEPSGAATTHGSPRPQGRPVTRPEQPVPAALPPPPIKRTLPTPTRIESDPPPSSRPGHGQPSAQPGPAGTLPWLPPPPKKRPLGRP